MFVIIGCLQISDQEYQTKMDELSSQEGNNTAELFILSPNETTILCPDAAVGDSGEVNEILYTKQDREGLLQLVQSEDWSAIETSCTSSIADMSDVFRGSEFDGDISTWDLSSTVNTSGMFAETTSFGGDISSWELSAVTDMSEMFRGAAQFNRDVSSWDVDLVADMRGMFAETASFNGDLSDWNVSAVTDMSEMFQAAEKFNGDLSNWEISVVNNTESMFRGTLRFNRSIATWDVSNITNMNGMFADSASFNQDLSGWCVSHFSAEPDDFDSGADAWTEPRPVWGTCP